MANTQEQQQTYPRTYAKSKAQIYAHEQALALLDQASPAIRQAYTNFRAAGFPDEHSMQRTLRTLLRADEMMRRGGKR